MYKKAFSLSIAALLCADSGAYSLKPDTLIRIPVHCGGLIRVAVKGDRIKDVITYPKSFLGVDVHKSGQLYIHSKNLPQTMQISIITQNGITQDIQFYCSKIDLEPIILEPETDADGYKDGKLLEEVLKKALKGELKYAISLKKEKALIRKTASLEWKPKEQWAKDPFIIRCFEAVNDTSNNIILKAEAEKLSEDLAVAFDQETIRPNQKAQMVVAIRNPLKASITIPQTPTGDHYEEKINNIE